MKGKSYGEKFTPLFLSLSFGVLVLKHDAMPSCISEQQSEIPIIPKQKGKVGSSSSQNVLLCSPQIIHERHKEETRSSPFPHVKPTKETERPLYLKAQNIPRHHKVKTPVSQNSSIASKIINTKNCHSLTLLNSH